MRIENSPELQKVIELVMDLENSAGEQEMRETTMRHLREHEEMIEVNTKDLLH